MERASGWLGGMPMAVVLLAAGVFFSRRTRLVQLRKLGGCFRQVCSGGRSSFRAVCTALAGTVGTGNVAGVAGAIALGGPGAVFWMWVSAFLGMATKYAEVVLALRYRQRGKDGGWRGGTMYAICAGLGRRWNWLAVWFAAGALLASLGMGNVAQIHTISSAAVLALPRLPPAVTTLAVGLLASVLVTCIASGGQRSVGRVMEWLLPALASVYILAALAVIIRHADRLGTAFSHIFRGAFSPPAVLGGGTGIGIRQAVRWGVTRGVFSNEAGLGSAPMAHASADAEPEVQGLYGMFEVFFDTIVLCTLTAVAILAAEVPIPYGQASGAELAAAALETVLGDRAAVLLAVCLGLLSLATMVTWQYYGAVCASYLFGSGGETVYRLLHGAVILLGATVDLQGAWQFSEVCNGLMCLPNLLALVLLSLRKPPCKTG